MSLKNIQYIYNCQDSEKCIENSVLGRLGESGKEGSSIIT